MKYKVIRDNYGYQKRFWHKDQIVELSDNETPPHHFEKITDEVVISKEEKEALSLAELGKQPVIITGMGAGLLAPEPAIRGRKKK